MLCNVTNFRKVEREGELPYFILKATGVEGNESAEVLDEDGVINPLACMSRRFNFTKTLFPATKAQADALEKCYTVDEDYNIVGEAPKVRLKSIVWAAPTAFYIRRDDSVTGVYETEVDEEREIVKNGKKVTQTVTRYIPKVFKEVNLTVFEDSNGKCVENGGDGEGLCKRAFERAVANDMYLLCESHPEITEQE